jgi:hypothetical protein
MVPYRTQQLSAPASAVERRRPNIAQRTSWLTENRPSVDERRRQLWGKPYIGKGGLNVRFWRKADIGLAGGE